MDLTSTELNAAEDTASLPPRAEEAQEDYFVAVEDMPGLGAIQRAVQSEFPSRSGFS